MDVLAALCDGVRDVVADRDFVCVDVVVGCADPVPVVVPLSVAGDVNVPDIDDDVVGSAVAEPECVGLADGVAGGERVPLPDAAIV